VSRPTAYEQAQTQAQRRRSMAQQFLGESTTAAQGFFAAWSGQIHGSADLAAKAALRRIETATRLAAGAARGVDVSL
jgi:hypothetical protein